MGRAQVMQAEAAGIKPSVLMNPILLKPTNDVGSQVIINGEVLGTMSAREYFQYKKQLIPKVMEAYDKLEEDYDIIVIRRSGKSGGNQFEKRRYCQYGYGKTGKSSSTFRWRT